MRVVAHVAMAALAQQTDPAHAAAAPAPQVAARRLAGLAAGAGDASAGPVGSGPLNYLSTVMNAPQSLPGSYMPCMVEDMTAMAVRVLGGRWYKCPNGHAYYVDQCGR